MANFAEIDDNNIVIRVLVVPDEQEHRGQDFLANDLGLGGTWVQTSYNHKIRKLLAGPGHIYDPVADIFTTPKPEPWYVLDENYDWVCPIGIKPHNGEVVTDDEWVWLEKVFGEFPEGINDGS